MLRLRGLRSGAVMQQIGRLFLEGSSIGLSEGELLDRFVRARDESAFEILVARHGPMVLGVCRSLLRDPNDVDDAFQATFLVLVRKAATLRQCDLVANWLYGVAIRVAMRARGQAARRMGRFGARIDRQARRRRGPGPFGDQFGRTSRARARSLASSRSQPLAGKVPDTRRALLFRGAHSR